jgi:hypothetical protein
MLKTQKNISFFILKNKNISFKKAIFFLILEKKY